MALKSNRVSALTNDLPELDASSEARVPSKEGARGNIKALSPLLSDLNKVVDGNTIEAFDPHAGESGHDDDDPQNEGKLRTVTIPVKAGDGINITTVEENGVLKVQISATGGSGDSGLSNRVSALETSQGVQDGRLGDIETKNTAQDNAITAAQAEIERLKKPVYKMFSSASALSDWLDNLEDGIPAEETANRIEARSESLRYIFLIPSENPEEGDACTEYLFNYDPESDDLSEDLSETGTLEQVGSVALDLDDYVQKTQAGLNAIVDGTTIVVDNTGSNPVLKSTAAGNVSDVIDPDGNSLVDSQTGEVAIPDVVDATSHSYYDPTTKKFVLPVVDIHNMLGESLVDNRNGVATIPGVPSFYYNSQIGPDIVAQVYELLDAGETVVCIDGDKYAMPIRYNSEEIEGTDDYTYEIFFCCVDDPESSNYGTTRNGPAYTIYSVKTVYNAGTTSVVWNTQHISTDKFDGEFLSDKIYDDTSTFVRGDFVYYPGTGKMYTPIVDSVTGVNPTAVPPKWGKVTLSRILSNIQTEVTQDVEHAIDTLQSRIIFSLDPSAVTGQQEINFDSLSNAGDANVKGTFFNPNMNFDISTNTNILFVVTQSCQGPDHGLTGFAYFVILRYDAATMSSPAQNTCVAVSEDISGMLNQTGMHVARIIDILLGVDQLKSDKLYYIALVTNYTKIYFIGNSIANNNVLSTAGFTFAFLTNNISNAGSAANFLANHAVLNPTNDFTQRFFAAITNLGFGSNWNVIMRTLNDDLGMSNDWLLGMVSGGSLFQAYTPSANVTMTHFAILDNQSNVPGTGTTNNCLNSVLTGSGNVYNTNILDGKTLNISTSIIESGKYLHTVAITGGVTLTAGTTYFFPVVSSLPNPLVSGATAALAAELSGSGVPTRNVYGCKNMWYVDISDSSNVHSCGLRTGFYLRINDADV